MNRHRQSVDLFQSKEEFPRREDLIRTLSRERGKDVSTDYSREQHQQHDFAKGRGVEPNQHTDAHTCLQDFKEQFETEHPERQGSSPQGRI